jgi:hypothetical protein
MTISAYILGILITTAIVVAAVSPIILLALWVNDWIKGQIW